MTSLVYWGKTFHARYKPEPHSFEYPLPLLLLDIDKLEELARTSVLFSHNSFSIFSIYDYDYLSSSGESLRQKLLPLLLAEGIQENPPLIYLLTMPRIMGYTFNPVNYYFVCRQDRSVIALVAEVNNTFGEKHVYVLKDKPTCATLPLTFNFKKDFYVSPFFEVAGEYEIKLKGFYPYLDLSVALDQSQQRVFFAGLQGTSQPFSSTALIRTLLKFPIALVGTVLRIHLQAVILYHKRSVNVFAKPHSQHKNTLRSNQTLLHRARLYLLSKLKRFQPLPGTPQQTDHFTIRSSP